MPFEPVMGSPLVAWVAQAACRTIEELSLLLDTALIRSGKVIQYSDPRK